MKLIQQHASKTRLGKSASFAGWAKKSFPFPCLFPPTLPPGADSNTSLPQQGILSQAILAQFILSINPPRPVTMPVPLLAFFLLEIHVHKQTSLTKESGKVIFANFALLLILWHLVQSERSCKPFVHSALSFNKLNKNWTLSRRNTGWILKSQNPGN